MDGSIIGAPVLPAPDASVLELDPALHHHAAALHYQQQATCHLRGLGPMSSTQYLNLGPDIDSTMAFDSRCASKSFLMCSSKEKSGASSEDDEPSLTEGGGECHRGGKGKKGSPWQRMKWTDSMVKLLIHIVVLLGEDGSNDPVDCNKKKSGMLQKKGKWKSVSRTMNERGCYVSPQQCEDKFNDLNKRYKRLNDLLGKGMACSVVEDPNLLECMDDLSVKSKDDVRKILSSKQLFYKEMCTYHSGCKSLLPSTEFDMERSSALAGNLSRSRDFVDVSRHHSCGGMDGCTNGGMDGSVDGGRDDERDDNDEDVSKDEEDEYEDNDALNMEQTIAAGGLMSPLLQKGPFKPFDGLSRSTLWEDTMTFALDSSSLNQIMGRQDGTQLTSEQQQWVHAHMIRLEEQKVGLLARALELEKQHFKWARVSSKRKWELEQLRLDNKRMKLENERTSLTLKQKELEVECKRSEASINCINLILERQHSKEVKSHGQQGQAME